MTILRETMRRYWRKFGDQELTIRVWREWPLNGREYMELDEASVANLIDPTLNPGSDTLKLATSILKCQWVNAVEVLDRNGNGDVLYKDWP